jgi:hypothetical protein
MYDLAVPPVSNVPKYTVSEISGAAKCTLEGDFGHVRVRGEITELTRYPSGHNYILPEGPPLNTARRCRRCIGRPIRQIRLKEK